MSEATNYLENKVLDHVFRNVSYTPPTAVYVGLFTVAPTDAGGGTEVAGGGYARQQYICSAAASGSISNNNTIEFPNTSWTGTVVAVGIFDASSGGNLLSYTTVTSEVVSSGEILVIAAAGLTVSLD